ncbi:alpha/beta fold hydrolase [Streptomyces lavendulae]|uniref:alpha/beta fold hydrolase n=1 Tax=Streptomyces lavendulae TaxID=1914 RepID=UPI0024A1E24B|nr:alpha/beta fold hydrolase [Streptomyces lavendulae]GLX16483.1 esterase [Streptomyces lavendulae subsp. lavendulae]GLX25103.1 esterase [Streptomyces lavendulae subsp. lavendulae]
MSEQSDNRAGGGWSRRGVLSAAAAGAGAVAAVGAGAPSAQADGRRRGAPTFVLVHGSGSNSYGWSPVLAELGLRGHRTIAVDLPGHGAGACFPLSYQSPQDLDRLATEPSPIGGVTLADFAEHVVGVVRAAHRNGPVVLVGQSLGGATLNAVANRVPELIAHLVYASAFCPTRHTSVNDLMATPEGATSALFEIPPVRTPPELGVNRVNWRSADPVFFAAVKEALAADRTDTEVRALLATLEPDESAAIGSADSRGLADRWGRVPRTFLRFTEDRSIPLALQDLMIREADGTTPRNRFRVRSVPAPHVGPRDAAVWGDELERVAESSRQG